jgi:hypothetical protein
MQKMLLIVLTIALLASCNKETKYSNIPKITFKDMSHSLVKAGSDSVIRIRFDFEDGDGNIGFGTNNLFLKDSRDTVFVPFMIPTIPDKFNPSDGLKGIIEVEYQAAFLLLRSDSLHLESDTLKWEIYMKDKAGNSSNTITTTQLVLIK